MRVRSDGKAMTAGLLTKRPEGEIVTAILGYLKTRRDVVAWRVNSGMAMMPGRGGKPMPVRFGGMKGMSDVIGWRKYDDVDGGASACVPPLYHGCEASHIARFLAIEVKRPGQKPTPEQQAFLDLVKAHGGIAFVARSIDDVMKELG